MAKKLMIVFLLALLVFPLATAQPPFQRSEFNLQGINIEVPMFESILVNQTFEFHAHAHNFSDGLLLKNDTTNCTIHLYDMNGDHLIESLMEWNGNDFDFELEVEGGNFSEIGQYAVLLYCEAIDENGDREIGGFFGYPFLVTYTGKTFSEGQAIVYASLLAIMIFIFVANIFFIEKLPSKNAQDEEGKILSISWLKYLRNTLWFVEWFIFIGILFLSSNIALAFLPGAMFGQILLSFFKVCLALSVPAVLIWIIWIFRNMFHDKEFQNMLNRGIFPQGKL